jgi:hypothetical protein
MSFDYEFTKFINCNHLLLHNPLTTQLSRLLLPIAPNAYSGHLLWFPKWEQRNPSQNSPPHGSLFLPNDHHFFSVPPVSLPPHPRNA